MDIARAAHHCAIARAVGFAGYAPVSVQSGRGWLAARSGADSNDLNVVVSEAGFLPSATLVGELSRWFAGVPASWLVEWADESLTGVLCGAGWTPERTGRWCGRPLWPIRPSIGGVEIAMLGADSGVDGWLDVAASCGWFGGHPDRGTRAELMSAMITDHRRGAWLASLQGHPVGMATGWCDGGAVELVDVAVREENRRRSVGTALVGRVVAWGAGRGAEEVVAAPSPDGWRLMRSLGFNNVGVVPDTCFYLSHAS